MQFSKLFTRVWLCVLAAGLLMLSGCDDLEARGKADEAAKQAMATRGLIEEANKKSDALDASIKALEARLTKHLDERIDKVAADVATNHKRVLEQIGADTKQNRDAATNLADTARADNNKELTATKAMVAENMQAIRTELAGEVDKLREFMDNQLKETYPYAYQPRRLDPAAPPGEPAPDAPKKSAEEPKKEEAPK